MELTPSNSTHIEMMSTVRDFVGQVVYVKPYEKVLKVVIGDDEVKVLFETYAYRETQTRIVFTKKGKRLWSWSRRTRRADTLIVWDESYTGEVIALYGKVRDADQDNFERDCYRPGTGRAPLDSHQRVLSGPTTERMTRHW